MKLIFISSIIFVICFILLPACNSNKTTQERDIKDTLKTKVNNDLIPVGDNYEWLYIKEGSTSSSDESSLKIESVSNTSDGKYIKFASIPELAIPIQTDKIFIKDDGAVYSVKGNDNQLIIPAEIDIRKDHSWTSGDWTGYIAGMNESVKTYEGKTFDNCIKINYALGYTYSVEIWIAKGYGVVKWGAFRTNPPTMNITYNILKSFKK